MQRIVFESWPVGMPTLLVFIYCWCQVSIETKNYKIRKDLDFEHGKTKDD